MNFIADKGIAFPGEMDEAQNNTHKIILAALAAVFILWGLAYIYHSSVVAIDGNRYFSLTDDAMISMRYAWNFSHGVGLVWNAGERVEGYTNLLMTLLMSLATFLFDRPTAVLAIQLVGIPFVLGTAWLALKIFHKVHEGARAGDRSLGGYLLVFTILAYYPMSYWSLMGMETGLLAFLVTGGVLSSLLYTENGQAQYLILSASLWGLAFLTRNDSLLYAGLTFVFIGMLARLDRPKLTLFLLCLGWYGLFVVGQEAVRYFYYHSLIPNTYTLKLVGMPLLERLRNGWGFTQLFLWETGLVLLIGLAGALIQPSIQKWYLLALMFVSIAYQIYIGGDAWTYWRMMTPTMPLLFVVFSIGCLAIAGWLEGISRKRVSGVAAFALVFLALLPADHRFLPEMGMASRPNPSGNYAGLINDAVALRAVTDSQATIGVFHAGIIPYYLADHKAIDFLGKSDVYIAHLPPDLTGHIAWNGMDSVPGHNKYDLNYSIKLLRPTYVELFVWGSQDIYNWSKDYYVEATYDRVSLYLLKGSPTVQWEDVHIKRSSQN